MATSHREHQPTGTASQTSRTGTGRLKAVYRRLDLVVIRLDSGIGADPRVADHAFLVYDKHGSLGRHVAFHPREILQRHVVMVDHLTGEIA